jgi:two-component system sensor histidine kinase UhpB
VARNGQGGVTAALLALLLYLCCGAAAAAESLRLLSGEFLPEASMRLPDDADPRWRPASLPDHWEQPGRVAEGSSGWYRFRVDTPVPAQEPWALYFLRSGINLAAYFNRSFVGDGGRFEEPMAFNANRPLLFAVPQPLLSPDGRNVVHVYLRGYPHFAGLYPPEAGPLRELQPRYDWRSLLQADLGFALMLMTMVTAFFSLTLYLRNRDQSLYLWFALCAACWSVFGAYMALHVPPVPGRWWLALIHSSIDWASALQLLFVHRFLGVRRPRIEKAMLALAAAGTLCNVLGGWWALRYLGSFFNLLSLLGLAYCLAFALGQRRQQRQRDTVLLCAGLALQLLCAAHDFGLALTRSAEWYAHSFFLLHLAVSLFLTALGWRVLDRSLVARRDVEQLNLLLETRVAEARRSLEQGFERRCELERQQSALEERERIHRDLHEDLGGKLLTLIHTGESEANVELARSALADLREVVIFDPGTAVSLRGTLAEMEAEAQQRTERAGCRLRWSYPEGGDDVEVASLFAFHLARILREAVSNALRHGAAPEIRVDFGLSGGRLRMQVADTGCGFEGSRPGIGMRSMCARTELLRGRIHWNQGEYGGTVVELQAPLPLVPVGEARIGSVLMS